MVVFRSMLKKSLSQPTGRSSFSLSKSRSRGPLQCGFTKCSTWLPSRMAQKKKLWEKAEPNVKTRRGGGTRLAALLTMKKAWWLKIPKDSAAGAVSCAMATYVDHRVVEWALVSSLQLTASVLNPPTMRVIPWQKHSYRTQLTSPWALRTKQSTSVYSRMKIKKLSSLVGRWRLSWLATSSFQRSQLISAKK